jgi:hypothetical protein
MFSDSLIIGYQEINMIRFVSLRFIALNTLAYTFSCDYRNSTSYQCRDMRFISYVKSSFHIRDYSIGEEGLSMQRLAQRSINIASSLLIVLTIEGNSISQVNTYTDNVRGCNLGRTGDYSMS